MSKKQTLIRKASGDQEPFSENKLENSLKRAGADDRAVRTIISEIKPWLYNGVSTKKIYKKALKLLTSYKSGLAARYSLKKAIMDLGPTGFPFEHFMGQLLQHLGFKTEVGQLLEGKCVTHEVDVVATGDKVQYFVECKFYNSQGKYADVKIPLYIHSRFNDIVDKRKNLPEYKDFIFKGWLITNTRFTSDAMDYGRCAGLKLMSWDFPAGHSLKNIIEREGLFPVTALTTLKKEQKQILLEKGIVLCSQIVRQTGILNKLGLSENKKKKIMEEINDVLINKPIN